MPQSAIIKPHAVEDAVAQMVRRLCGRPHVGVRQAAVRRDGRDGLVHATRGPADDGSVGLLDGDDTGQREDVRVGRAGYILLDRFQPLDGLGEARVATVELIPP